jgi:hypothetical protein
LGNLPQCVLQYSAQHPVDNDIAKRFDALLRRISFLIAVAAGTIACQRRSASNMRWLLRDKAVERSSKLGCAAAARGTGSTIATRSSSGASASARLVPIMPPPARRQL